MKKGLSKQARLFDTLKKEAKMKTDIEVAASIGVNKAALCNMKAGRIPVTPAVILRIMDAHGISLARIRSLMD